MDTLDDNIDQNQSHNESQGGNLKAKSCKGHLYYSSILRSKAHNPRCIGISRTLSQVPGHIIEQTEVEASKDGRNLMDFTYGCLGYSIYLDKMNKDPESNRQGEKLQLPVCIGLELLVEKRASTHDHSQHPAPSQIHNREGGDSRDVPLPRKDKATNPVGDDFFSRYTRNANLVASAVSRNMRKVGNHIKESIEDLISFGRRSK